MSSDSLPIEQTDASILAGKAKVELAKRELSRRKLIDFIKYNFQDYQVNWHHKVIADKLEQVEAGKITRLMLFLPPRHGKSELGSVQFPAWYLGRNPKKEIICSSYTSDLAVDFGRRVRNLVGAAEYKNLFGVSLSEDSAAANKWKTNEGGGYVAVGVGGPTTGRGADCFIIDDPFKNRKEADSPLIREQAWKWYISTVYTRLSPTGSIILINTRWHDDDLAGRLLSQKEGDKWDVVSFPAIAINDERISGTSGEFFRKKGEALWPDRYSLQKLEQTRSVLGSYEWAALYQQTPVDDSSIEFLKSWFKVRTEEEVSKLDTRRFLTVDTAGQMTSRSDYMGFCDNRVDREGNWNIRGFKYKISSADLVELLFSLQEQYHYEKIGIEKTIYLDSLKPFLDLEMMKRKKPLPIFQLKHSNMSKELRIRGLIPRYQSGKIFHIDGECFELEPQLLRFPRGKEDDIMDAVAYQDQVADTPFGFDNETDRQEINQSKSFDRFSPIGSF